MCTSSVLFFDNIGTELDQQWYYLSTEYHHSQYFIFVILLFCALYPSVLIFIPCRCDEIATGRDCSGDSQEDCSWNIGPGCISPSPVHTGESWFFGFVTSSFSAPEVVVVAHRPSGTGKPF